MVRARPYGTYTNKAHFQHPPHLFAHTVDTQNLKNPTFPPPVQTFYVDGPSDEESIACFRKRSYFIRGVFNKCKPLDPVNPVTLKFMFEFNVDLRYRLLIGERVK